MNKRKKRKISSQNDSLISLQSSKRKKTTPKDTEQSGENSKNEVDYKNEMMVQLDEELKCNICTELLIKPTVLNCSHMFCEYCIKRWKEEQERCPICREPIEYQILVTSLEAFMEKVSGMLLGHDQKKARDAVIRQRERTKRPKPRRSARLRNRPYVFARSFTPQAALEARSFHLYLLDESLRLLNFEI